MNFEISWSPQAAKYLESLPKEVAARVLHKLDEVIQNPFRYLEHFEGAGYKLRIGDYRALIDVDLSQNILKI